MKNLMTLFAIVAFIYCSLCSSAGIKAEDNMPLDAKKRKLCEFTAAVVNYPSAMLGNSNSETEVKVIFSVRDDRLNIMSIKCNDEHVKEYVTQKLTQIKVPGWLQVEDTVQVSFIYIG